MELVSPDLNAADALLQTDHTVFPVTGTSAAKVNWMTWIVIIILVRQISPIRFDALPENTFAWYGVAPTPALNVPQLKHTEAVSRCINKL